MNDTYNLPFKFGDIVAELGGGSTPTFHPNIDMRQMSGVDIVTDLSKKLPVPDNSYNGIFSKFNLEHISWRRIRFHLGEIYRILKPGGTAVWITANIREQARAIVNSRELDDSLVCAIFGGQKFDDSTNLNEELEQDWDMNSHHAGFDPAYITKLLKEIGYKNIKTIPIQTNIGLSDMVVEATKEEQLQNTIQNSTISSMSSSLKPIDAEFKDVFGDSGLKLNIGSFTVMHPRNWVNLDVLDLAQYAKQNNFIFHRADCSKNIPYQNSTVDLISASHFIEHLDKAEGKQFLREAIRVLKPGGLIRLTIPDAETITKDYLSGNISRHASHNEGVKNAESDTESLFHLLIAGHKTIYDLKSLTKLLKDTGFTDIEKMGYKKSKSKIMEEENIDMYPELSLYVEAVKGLSTNSTMLSNRGAISTMPSNRGAIINYNKCDSTMKDTVIPTKLKIALISTPFFTVPPSKYGGLEQVVYDLAEGLDELGHNVTIFAPEGSKSSKHGKVIFTGPSIDTVNVEWYKEEERVYNSYKNIITPEDYDIVIGHNWFGYEYMLKYNNPRLRVMHVHHGWYQWDKYPPFKKSNLVAISKWMKNNTELYFKQIGYNIQCEFAYNGVDLDKYKFDPTIKRTNRLLYVGRFSRFKQPDMAIRVAKAANLPIDLIGGTFVEDPNYMDQIERMCDGENIVMYKDASHEFKIKKLQEAKALLVPSKMGEPFGLTCVEGMACGAPVIASRDGAIPEIVLDTITGYICDTEEQMVYAIKELEEKNQMNLQKTCRMRAEEFSRRKMAERYQELIYRIIKGEDW